MNASSINKQIQPSASQMEIIRQRNNLDIQLYKFAVRLFERRLERLREDPTLLEPIDQIDSILSTGETSEFLEGTTQRAIYSYGSSSEGNELDGDDNQLESISSPNVGILKSLLEKKEEDI